MVIKETKEFKANKCKHFDGNYCKKKSHLIEGGYAEIAHCLNCKYFEE